MLLPELVVVFVSAYEQTQVEAQSSYCSSASVLGEAFEKPRSGFITFARIPLPGYGRFKLFIGLQIIEVYETYQIYKKFSFAFLYRIYNMAVCSQVVSSLINRVLEGSGGGFRVNITVAWARKKQKWS